MNQNHFSSEDFYPQTKTNEYTDYQFLTIFFSYSALPSTKEDKE